MRCTTIDDYRGLDPIADCIHAGFRFRDHTALDRAIGNHCIDTVDIRVTHQLLIGIKDTFDISQHIKATGTDSLCNGTGSRISIDIVCLTVFTNPYRCNYRNNVGIDEAIKHMRIDLNRFADKAQIKDLLDIAFGIAFGALKFARLDQMGILATQTNADTPCTVYVRNDFLVDLASQNHFDNVNGLLIGDAKAINEFGLDVKFLEHLADLRTAAMSHNRVHADLL